MLASRFENNCGNARLDYIIECCSDSQTKAILLQHSYFGVTCTTILCCMLQAFMPAWDTTREQYWTHTYMYKHETLHLVSTHIIRKVCNTPTNMTHIVYLCPQTSSYVCILFPSLTLFSQLTIGSQFALTIKIHSHPQPQGWATTTRSLNPGGALSSPTNTTAISASRGLLYLRWSCPHSKNMVTGLLLSMKSFF